MSKAVNLKQVIYPPLVMVTTAVYVRVNLLLDLTKQHINLLLGMHNKLHFVHREGGRRTE